MNRYVAALLGAALGLAIILPSQAADLKVRGKLPPVCANYRIRPTTQSFLRSIRRSAIRFALPSRMRG